MAGSQERELRRRIRSIQSTKKITKAMELIAASQIVRAQNRIAANRPYREGVEALVAAAVREDPTGALATLTVPENPAAVGIVCLVADRGLAGSYNSGALRLTERLVNDYRKSGVNVQLVTIGKKALGYFRFRGIDAAQTFVGFSEKPTMADARRVAATVTGLFETAELDVVTLVSTRYLSAGSQSASALQLLPLPLPEGLEPDDESTTSVAKGYTEFEPDADVILKSLAPRFVESEIFSALLEGSASFFTAQQRAMAAASDNADEFIKTLSRIMNRARQDSITTEIMEIVGGAEALRQGKEA